MKALLNPKWLIIIHHLPVIILAFLFLGHFRIINTLLEPSSVQVWSNLGVVLLILSLAHIGFSVFMIRTKQQLPGIYGLITLLIYVPFLYWYYAQADEVLPRVVPRWMANEELHLYLGAFLMPTLAHGLFVMVSKWTQAEQPHKAWLNFLIALGVPGLWYLFMQVVFPLWRGGNSHAVERIAIIAFIFSTIFFLFFLVRAIYIMVLRRTSLFEVNALWWKIPITIIFPLLGLALNNGVLDDSLGYSIKMGDEGVFGKFTHPLFYLLAIINGFLLCLPDWENKSYRLPLFIGRAICFAYTIYFLLIFLPFLPLSLIAILAFGAGFLMLTPLALFVVHIDHLRRDFRYLQQHFSKRVVLVMAGVSMLLLPIAIHVNYAQDRRNLKKALAYLYNPDYDQSYQINRKDLGRTIGVLRQHKKRSSTFFMSNKLPFLSAYYNWLVLDNLTLSNQKIDKLDAVFNGNPYYTYPRRQYFSADSVAISDLSITSNYDTHKGVWESTVDLEITNAGRFGNQEYATHFELPPACWISDYYLYVGDKKEPGILSEKKAATWIFNQIRNANRDPGILYYEDDQKIVFRVFPFASREVRKTGISFIHPEPVNIQFDGRVLNLGESPIPLSAGHSGEDTNSFYLSSQTKQTLDTVYRKPYFHFIIDHSEKVSDTQLEKYFEQIEQLKLDYPELSNDFQISVTNAYVKPLSSYKDWQSSLLSRQKVGGFYLEQALRQALAKHYHQNTDSYPVIVVLSNEYRSAIMERSLAHLSFAQAEGAFFHHIDLEGRHATYSLKDTKEALDSAIPLDAKTPVLVAKRGTNEYYLPADSKPTIAVNPNILDLNQSLFAKGSLEAAIWQEAYWKALQLQPHRYPSQWRQLLKTSFESGIMSPVSAYLVVENEAQRAMLRKKQEQVLKGDSNYDLEEEETRRMSEPGFWVLILGLFLVSLLRSIKRRKA